MSVAALRFNGLVAATFTPFHEDGSLNLDPIGPMVERLIRWKIAGLYVVGSTGEGVSLSGEERRAAAEAFVRAADGNIPVIVQVGHNSLVEARQLATHAQKIGVSAISATPPGYFKPNSAETLADCMAEVAAGAPDTPFYYYHVPHMSGAAFPMRDFLHAAAPRIPTLVGIKYTASTFHDMQACLQFDNGRYEILHGFDELLLSGLAIGAKAAVGSTYNFAAPLYHQVIRAFAAGDLDESRRWQFKAVEMIRVVLSHGVLPGLKAMMGLIGLDCGPTRLPLTSLSKSEVQTLREELTALGFFEWIKTAEG